MHRAFTIIFLLPFFCTACNAQSYPTRDDFPYALDKPDKVFKLDKDLEEISGLGLTDDPNLLVSVDDEEGDLFFVSLKNGKITADPKFGKDDDYEGVEFVNGTYYVLESNGHIHEIEYDGDDADKKETYNTFLKRENDVEGLGYDAKRNLLMLACKSEYDDYDDERVVFGFDLATKELLKEPILRFTEDSLYAFVERRGVKNGLIKMTFAKGFAPSAIAQHPQTGYWYILSSPKRLLLVIDEASNLIYLEQLSEKLARQPEGICFAPDGTMYISSEGKGAKARLLIYSQKINKQ
ncbi:MAG: SdiA-regulated domain-containing protein [Bacteroidota bacterium]